MAPIMGPTQEKDRRPHRRNPVIAIAEAVPAGRGKKDRYDTKPSGIPGVSHRIEFGSHPRISVSETGDALVEAREFRQADALAKLHTGNRKKLREKLVPRFKRHRGWRGIISEPDDLILRADESEENVVYDAFLLRESMNRDWYRKVVRKETVIVEFPLPKGVHPEVAVDSMVQAVADIGIRAARSTRITIKPDVDENELARGLKSGEVKLKHGARRSRRRISLTPDLFIKNPPKAEKPS
jgi:hypothetical protein